ncbi:MAG TPA: Atxe2 family lasso peptide isopeptidase [Sphingobium sp.]|uniref:Atxe2 family lasso peptide isopeptidase n=1 Tax=Sphingobium sp. TaxID=1912891 RepID=UPI002ED41B18
MPEDLARLRDIGANDAVFPNSGSLALSPDGSKIAFQIRQANPETNGICLAMVALPLRPGSHPVVIDQGGELIRASYDFRGKAAYPTGVPLPIAPRWSPDGSWVAFLKREGSIIQVWRADAAGGSSAPITLSPVDVEDFRISVDGRSIFYWTRPSLAAAREQIQEESLVGYHFDDRFAPMASNRPFAAPPLASVVWRQELGTNVAVPTTEDETVRLAGGTGKPDGALSFTRGATGRRAWSIQSAEDVITSQVHLFADGIDGRSVRCEAQACHDRIGGLWWTGNDESVRFFRREGWGREAIAIYDWRPGPLPPTRIFSTNAVLADCVPQGTSLLCLQEAAAQPRRIVSIDPTAGTTTLVFDPNPEFGLLLLGRVERFRWRNSVGLETFGDVVFPVDYRPGQKYPAIIVQYESRGFLRGGTGDEYPIQAFANRGYVVLSFNRPQMVGLLRGGRSAIDVEKRNLAGFAERRSLLSALEAGIDQLVRRGIVDRQRIGITGLSDGVTTVQFALSNGSPFAAAAVSTAPWSQTYPIMVGPAAAREFAAQGYPKLTEREPEFWRQFSLVSAARSIRTPILMQLADDSYLGALESFTTLRERHLPVDLFIFSNEFHVKWQPAHRLAIYRRNLDWFDYWLKGIRSLSSDRQADLARWDVLKQEGVQSGSYVAIQ